MSGASFAGVRVNDVCDGSSSSDGGAGGGGARPGVDADAAACARLWMRADMRRGVTSTSTGEDVESLLMRPDAVRVEAGTARSAKRGGGRCSAAAAPRA